MATAKALLSRKDNSFECEDRVVLLSSSPLRIGRSHKEEKADSDNGYFDCKVLSRNHANLSFEDGKFFIQAVFISAFLMFKELKLLRELQLHGGNWEDSELDKLLRLVGNQLIHLGPGDV